MLWGWSREQLYFYHMRVHAGVFPLSLCCIFVYSSAKGNLCVFNYNTMLKHREWYQSDQKTQSKSLQINVIFISGTYSGSPCYVDVWVVFRTYSIISDDVRLYSAMVKEEGKMSLIWFCIVRYSLSLWVKIIQAHGLNDFNLGWVEGLILSKLPLFF